MEINYKNMWMFFSVLVSALEENIGNNILERWHESGMFEKSVFGDDDLYIRQGVNQVRLWLVDFQKDPSIKERLNEDYLQLFVGTPKPLAPFYGSYYLDKEKVIFHDISARVGRWYQKYGLAVPQEKGLPEDYLAYELAFLSVLLNEYQSAMKGEREKAVGHVQNLIKFSADEMLPWISLWREDVMLYGRTEYYRGLSNMVYGGIRYLAGLEVAT